MKKFVLLTLLFLAVLTIQAQQLSYAYDDAGNRVSRTLTVGARSADATTQPNSLFFEETLAERQVKIYPSSQSAELTIAVSGYDVSLVGEY